MCGLAGFLNAPGLLIDEAARATAVSMRDTLVHRGPDDAGVWVDGASGVAMAHRRLSVLDLSPEGHQPMLSTDGRFVLVYNGEVYNHAELRRELSSRSHRFRGHSDTEVMLAAFMEWGVAEAVRRFNGMFAFAAWDTRHRQLYLSRDRMGEKPLYYGWMGSTLVFASELKAVRAHPAFRGDVSREALALYMRYGYVPAPYSIYAGLSTLPAGTLATVAPTAPGRVDLRPYWSLRDAVVSGRRSPFSGDANEAVAELERLLLDAVRLRMHADVPLGAFLSGGIDSSTVVALMQAQSSLPVRTFTIGFADQDFDEAKDAKRVARHLGTDHTELYLGAQDALDVIPRIPELYDEPFADASQIPTFLVAQLARRHVTVSVSGDGGDELFGGYVRYQLGADAWAWGNKLPPSMRRGLGSGLGRASPAAIGALYAGLSWLLPARLRQRNPADKVRKLADLLSAESQEDVYLRLVSHWQEPGAVVIGAAEPRTAARREDLPEIEDARERMMYRDALTYLPDDILVKVDRATMAVSLEARVPLLDHRVVELAWRLPASIKVRDGESKWILRQVLHRHVPAELVQRPKAGFSVPIDAWLRGALRPWAEDLLSEERLRAEGFFDPGPIRRALSEHLSGAHNRQSQLWNVLMFQAWLDGASRRLPGSAPAAPIRA